VITRTVEKVPVAGLLTVPVHAASGNTKEMQRAVEAQNNYKDFLCRDTSKNVHHFE